MRTGIDGTPLLGARTGIGRYVSELLGALVAPGPGWAHDDLELVVAAFTLRGSRALVDAVPTGAVPVRRPLPARPLQWAWARGELPTVTSLVGRVDVFHATNFVLPPVGRAAGVVTVHDLAYRSLPHLVSPASLRYQELVPRSLHRARVVCVPSRAIADELAEVHPEVADRVVVTPLGVSATWTRPRTGPPAVRRHLLYVGTVEPRKGLPTVIEALRLALARGADVPPLVIAGAAGWGAELDLHGLPPTAVQRVGHVSDAELLDLVDGAVALLLPSVYEGFGLPVLEAFARGIPVIASDIPTTVEITGQVPGGARLFPVGDAGALAEVLATAGDGETPGLAQRRRDLARAHTWQRTAEATVAAWRRALG